MRIAAWIPLIFAPSWNCAADTACCRLFGFDASPMLGDEAAICGEVVDADEPNQSRSETVEDRRRATRCALDAQARGLAFVYTYRLLAAPDIDLVTQAVFGAHGERLLLRMGLYGGENIRTVESCASLSVQPDGQVARRGCRARRGILDQLLPD